MQVFNDYFTNPLEYSFTMNLYPFKYYYLSDRTKKTYVTIQLSSYSKSLYKINANHNYLMSFISLLDHTDELELAQKHFFEYCNSILEGSIKKDCIKKICAYLNKLHPFFHIKENRIQFIESCLLKYFSEMYKTLISIILTDIKKEVSLDEKYDIVITEAKNLFKSLFSPICNFYDESKTQHYEILFSHFLLAADNTVECGLNRANANSFLPYRKVSEISIYTTHLIKCYYNHPDSFTPYSSLSDFSSKYVFLKELQRLHKVLNSYIYGLSDILINANNLSVGQFYCFFYRDSVFRIYENALKDCKKIYLSPFNICQFLNSNIYDEDVLDDPHILFDTKTHDAYETLSNAIIIKDSTARQNSIANAINIMEALVPSKLDYIFNLDITECHSFEQLIYLELQDCIINKQIIRKCQHCSNYYITTDKKRKFCDSCKCRKTVYDKKYTDSRSPFQEIQKVYYNYFYNQKKQDIAISSDIWNNWCHDTEQLVKKYESTHIYESSKPISEQQAQFIIELNCICTSFNLSYKGNSKKLLSIKD